MDVKNVSDFFRRKNVDVLSEQTVFGFIISHDNVQEPALADALEKLFVERPAEKEGEQALAEQEVENQVFRKQYIPQTLDQVYDFERDAEKVGNGQKDDLVYRNLLADKVPMGSGNEADGEDTMGASSEPGSGEDGSGTDDSDDESRFEKGIPRGKRFEDKEAKRVCSPLGCNEIVAYRMIGAQKSSQGRKARKEERKDPEACQEETRKFFG